MKRRFEILIFTFLLLCVQLVHPKEEPKDELAGAQAAAKENLRTTEGCRYDQIISEEFPVKYQTSMQRCTKSAAEKDLANFEVLMKIGVDGIENRLCRCVGGGQVLVMRILIFMIDDLRHRPEEIRRFQTGAFFPPAGSRHPK